MDLIGIKMVDWVVEFGFGGGFWIKYFCVFVELC